MRKIIILLFSFGFLLTLNAQETKTCNKAKEVSFEDLNSITKCSLKPSSKGNKKGGMIKVKVSASKKRYLKKRKGLKLDSNGLTKIEAARKKSTLSVSNLLSIEEVKKAKRFIDVDEIPAFKNCTNTEGEESATCYNEQMVKHIEKYFNYPDEAIIKKIEGDVWVRFIIDKNGNVTNIFTKTLRSGKELLKDEAARVVSNLNKFVPATKDGKPVAVKYGFPITFSLGE